MPAITPLAAAQHGVIDLHGLKVIYGSQPLNSFVNDPGSGGYKSDINISQHSLSGNLWCGVTAQYPGGHPIVNVGNVSSSTITLLSDVSISGAYALWVVIGASA